MNFLKRLFRNRHKAAARYATVDYGHYFEKAVVNGIALECRSLGNLVLSSGFVVACDPLLGLHDALPFTRRMRTGEYPVSMLVTGSRLRRRNAIVMITFTDKRAAQWEQAVMPGRGGRYGFTVEAGIGCLCDAHSQKHYNRYLERFFRDHPESDIYHSLSAGEISVPAQVDEDGNSFNFNIPARPNLNVILFNTGYGDGIYPAYWGITKEGEVCSLVIDFMVL